MSVDAITDIKNALTNNDIEFTIDYSSAWTVRIHISSKKANLAKIDKLYKKFYDFVNDNSDFIETMKNWNNIFYKIA